MEKDTITYRYFVAEGEDAKAVAAEAKAQQRSHADRVGAVVRKYDADCAWGGSRSPLAALGFVHRDGVKPEMKEGFLSAKVESSGNSLYNVYYPDKRYKEGKAAKKDLEAVGIFHFSDFVTRKLGIACDCFGTVGGRMVRAISAAGLYGETLVLRLPFSDDTRPRDIVLPQYLREIKKSEFIAITEEG